jgi:hypothetical protein
VFTVRNAESEFGAPILSFVQIHKRAPDTSRARLEDREQTENHQRQADPQIEISHNYPRDERNAARTPRTNRRGTPEVATKKTTHTNLYHIAPAKPMAESGKACR